MKTHSSSTTTLEKVASMYVARGIIKLSEDHRLHLDDVTLLAEKYGLPWRYAGGMQTGDYVRDRLNIKTDEAGYVVEVKLG